MRKKRRILFVGLLAVFLCALVWLVLSYGEPEPVYQGKPLSYWLEVLTRGNYARMHPEDPSPPTRDQATAAVREMGTNAIPSLLRILEHHDSKLKTNIINLLQKQHLIKINYKPLTPFHAFFGFEALGPLASNAVPRLIDVFDHDPSAFSQQAIPVILSHIGPAAEPAVPMLIRGSGHTNACVRFNAVWALGKIQAQPGLVVLALAKSLNDSDASVRRQAADNLGAFGKDAQSAIPALLESLAREKAAPVSGNVMRSGPMISMDWRTAIGPGGAPDVAEAVQEALKKIDPAVAAKIGVK